MGAGAKPAIMPTKWHDADDIRWAVRNWAARIGVKAPEVCLEAMDLKWASVSTTGQLKLNLELLHLPRELGEFVIVHELVHLLAPDHGKLFKCFMHAYMPDWQERERRLQACAGASSASQSRGPEGRTAI